MILIWKGMNPRKKSQYHNVYMMLRPELFQKMHEVSEEEKKLVLNDVEWLQLTNSVFLYLEEPMRKELPFRFLARDCGPQIFDQYVVLGTVVTHHALFMRNSLTGLHAVVELRAVSRAKLDEHQLAMLAILERCGKVENTGRYALGSWMFTQLLPRKSWTSSVLRARRASRLNMTSMYKTLKLTTESSQLMKF
jgi:hypothetical protein